MDLAEGPELSLAAELWQDTRFEIFHDVLAAAGAFDAPVKVLDVGAGDAWFARQLAAREPSIVAITCWDTGYDDPAAVARAGVGPEKIELSAERPEGAFDVVLALDVLEHVPDDVGFFSSVVAENLAPSGYAFVSVPAHPSLFGEHDRRLRHHRRYDVPSARSVLERSGLSIVRSGGAFYVPLAVRAAQVAAERAFGARPPPSETVGGRRLPATIAALMHAGFRVERTLAAWTGERSMDLPGLSWWALCRKSS